MGMDEEMKLILENWREYLKESLEWQHEQTEKAFDEAGYQQNFLDKLEPDQRRRLRAELSHHLMTSLTGPMGNAELEGAENTLEALKATHERLKRLLNTLMPL